MSSAREIQATEAAAQRAYAAAKPTNLTPPATFTTSSQRAPLVQKPMSSPRPGANDNRLVKSLPMGPQITLNSAFLRPQTV